MASIRDIKTGEVTNLPVADKDYVLHDDVIGIDRIVKAGQPVPVDLLDAYEAQGGKFTDTDGGSGIAQRPGQLVASKDVTVYDELIGVDRLIVAGQPVPPELLDAYTAATGEKAPAADDAAAEKAQRAPAKDKAQRAPSASK